MKSNDFIFLHFLAWADTGELNTTSTALQCFQMNVAHTVNSYYARFI